MDSGFTTERAVTEGVWADAAQARLQSDDWKLLSWDAHPLTLAHFNRLVSGDPAEHWLNFVHRTFVPRGVDFGLSIGCGSGILERHAIGAGLCKAMEACDVSPGAVVVAEQLARSEGYADRLRYFVCDLNTASLERGKYGICFSGAALHHIENLEHALAEIRCALRPDGLLVLVEYVGPNRFQWDDKTQRLMDQLLSIIPRPYRTSLREPGIVKEQVQRPAVDQVVTVDPSEAVRSADILPVLERSFEIVYRANLGGTLLQFLLADIVGNFRVDVPHDAALLKFLILFEETLIKEAIIPSDFVMAVARPYPGVNSKTAGE
jgi:SAM-dependent methyltransferase